MGAVAAFCKILIGLLFAASAAGKVKSPQAFVHAVGGFRLVPRSWTAPAAFLIVTAELGISGLVLLGGPLLIPGLALAGAFLLVFTAALASVLTRRLQTPCHCLGASGRQVAIHHLWRNLGFMAVAGIGLWASVAKPEAPPNLVDWALAALAAAALLLVSVYLDDLLEVLKASPEPPRGDVHGALHADDARP